ncbi:hypothetical protein GVAV_000822 [Gurleya vavrai]
MIILQLKFKNDIHVLKSKEKLNIESVKQFVHKTTGKSNIDIMLNGSKFEDNDFIVESMEVDVVVKSGCGIQNCKIKIRSETNCKMCEKFFCGKHRLPEEHFCMKIDDWKKEAMKRNANALDKFKVGNNKLGGK